MNTHPLVLHQKISEKTVPSMRYTGQMEFGAWQEKCREQLKALLGMDKFIRCEPDLTITEDVVKDGMRRIHFLVQTEEGYYTHCDFLLPDNIQRPLPLCVCLQGHSSGAHISLGIEKYKDRDGKFLAGGDRDFAVRAVREGFCALAIEQRGFGQNGAKETGAVGCDRPSVTALLLGRTTIGERVWDISRVLDVVKESFSHIATLEGSVCMGNSGGGTATYYAACLEPRFSAYMPSCAVCTFHDSVVMQLPHCVCNFVPGIMNYFDMGDMAAMIAPKKLVVVNGTEDKIFPLHGAKKTFELIQSHYATAGKPDNCVMVIGEGGHRFYADDAWPVMKELLAK